MANQNIEVLFDDKDVVNFFKFMRTNLASIKNGEKRFVGLLSAIVYRDVMEHFKDEQGENSPWQDWSDSYDKHMQSIGRAGNKLLQFTGKLRQNFKPSNVRGTGQALTWYNDAQTKSGFPYAAAHDEGGAKLPPREFMWLSDKGAEDISQQTLQFMLDEGI